MSKCVWLIGRGASIACNLCWGVPESWKLLERDVKIEKIKQAITGEMNQRYINTTPYKSFLQILSSNTVSPWRHQFITTNWDYLLQREMHALDLQNLPKWLADSHVDHLNGTVEILEDNSNRSPFLLEEDPLRMRVSSVEANVAFGQMIWERLFVVVGMSFECQMDKFLLSSLNKVEDNLPIGESKWLIVNPDQIALEQSAERIKQAMPRATVATIKEKFDVWVNNRMPQLTNDGIFTFQSSV